jgi:cathepsin H
MTAAEVKTYYNLKGDQQCSATEPSNYVPNDIPVEWDWRELGGVSPVKDQGNCGSCWAFSSTGCLESRHLIQYGNLQTYSEQQLIDCSGNFENYGCNGGLPSHAFEYLSQDGNGATSELAYPYTAADGTCNIAKDPILLNVWYGAYNITAGDEVELADAVYGVGPVSVAFQVVDDFFSYTSGIYTSDTCCNTQECVNHAVLAVGYGVDVVSGMDYWIIKNSWGTNWGDQGFFKMERGVNMCGIAMCNSYPTAIWEHRCLLTESKDAFEAEDEDMTDDFLEGFMQ